MPSRDTALAIDHPAFAGHFPGRPILPGVGLLAEVMEALLADASAAAAMGAAPRLGAAKFITPCLPGDRLTIHWELLPKRVTFEVRRRGAAGDAEAVVAATGHFENAT